MLRKLTLKAASWSAISAINTGQAPPLVGIKIKVFSAIKNKVFLIFIPKKRSLNLAWSDISDCAIEEMTSCPTGHLRPGIPVPHSRLMRVQELIIDGANITDVSLLHISKLPELRSLSIVGKVLNFFQLIVT